MARPGKSLTIEQIETAKATYAETGNYRASARAAGCSAAAAKTHVDNVDEFEQIRAVKRIDIIEKITEAQGKLIEAMVDAEHLRRATVQEIGVVFGIITDKKLLLTGQATARIETGAIDLSRLSPAERTSLADLREKVMSDGAGR
jgi:hypothetical protein